MKKYRSIFSCILLLFFLIFLYIFLEKYGDFVNVDFHNAHLSSGKMKNKMVKKYIAYLSSIGELGHLKQIKTKNKKKPKRTKKKKQKEPKSIK